MGLRTMFSRVARFADRLTDSKSTKFVLNSLESIRRYGEIVDLHIDRHSKELLISIMLKGEARAITVIVNSYTFSNEGKVKFFTATKVSCPDRQWLDLLVKDTFAGRPLLLPVEIADAVELFLNDQ